MKLQGRKGKFSGKRTLTIIGGSGARALPPVFSFCSNLSRAFANRRGGGRIGPHRNAALPNTNPSNRLGEVLAPATTPIFRGGAIFQTARGSLVGGKAGLGP